MTVSTELIRMEHITKEFPGVKALDDVSFELSAGEVHALVGENGAGKSTLMKVLTGQYIMDSGKIFVRGKEASINSVNDSQKLGIIMIHQELNLMNHLTAAQNIFIGREKLKHHFILNDAKLNEQAEQIFRQLNINIDPTIKVGRLTVAKQQMVEIAKALSTNARILIMDEPTSALTENEIEEMFRIIRQLREEGKGIVYISHRLEELQHIVDRVTIMRDGRYITEGDFADMGMSTIIANMVGREIKEKFPRVHCQKGKKIFEVRNLNAGRMVRDVSFSSYEGEILGFAGLMGAGRTETTRAIFGVDPRESGQFFLDGKEIRIKRPMDAIRQGVVLAPEDRKRDGLCTKLSIRSNIELPNLDIASNKAGVVNRRKVTDMVDRAKQNFSIKMPNDEVDAGSLSGGNQQKLVVGKWLARQSRVVIFDEPTRGIDVAAKVEIYNLMNQLKQQGISVIFVSSEMPEVLGIADRIIVMCDGRITGEMDIADATQEKILELATQFETKISSHASEA